MINGISRYTNYQSTSNATAKKDRVEEMFTNIDTNGDGSVDKAEFTAFGRQMAAKIGKADKSEEIFSAVDTDGDGQVSKAEFEAFGEKMKGQMKPGPSPEEIFSKMDTDGDGSIDKTEFKAFGQKRAEKTGESDQSDDIFSQIDTNGDGQISMAELTAIDEKMKSRMKDETPIAANTAIDARNDSNSTLLDALNQDSNTDNTLYQNTIQQYAANIDAFTPSSNLDILG